MNSHGGAAVFDRMVTKNNDGGDYVFIFSLFLMLKSMKNEHEVFYITIEHGFGNKKKSKYE